TGIPGAAPASSRHDGTEPVAASTAPGSAAGPERQPAPDPPAAAATVFGDRLAVAARFADVLADTGVSHGLIGPREVPILWERHILNCAVVHEAFPHGARIADVGSGAGLPGLALAIARPDLRLHLVEPLLRRTTWLEDTVRTLGLDNVTVVRARAEELHGQLHVPYATARAVARIDKLARWTFPLLAPGGELVALKGSSAADELAAQEPVLRRLGMTEAVIETYGSGLLDPATVVVRATVRPPASSGSSRGRTKSRRRSA
ncbi:16S rRNA (guanine(527)-N(7))-methyltransferase RsmG, partial [Pedococcus sp. NPDC057267]|uniref:16S rRNA (guanine(527)-N(7))-methyltransferase RsmG n=1 Tax=Pedococcus sp. NPDC057267 TaxID=3346077 RepID=UPI003642EFC3